MRVGVIRNRLSPRARGLSIPGGVEVYDVDPATPGAVRDAVRALAAQGVERLVVVGGDGTAREAVGAAVEAFGGRPPPLAIVPAGKTNALALDLGASRRWTIAGAVEAANRVERPPLEVRGPDGMRRGFMFGAGAFVEATRRAAALHRGGVVGRPAVLAALAGAALRLLVRHPSAAEDLVVRMDDEAPRAGPRLVLLATSLERLPLRLQPFGPPRAGLKVLDVDAAPRRLPAALPRVLSGRDAPWLEAAGYRRRRVERLQLSAPGGFVLDGEVFTGGELEIALGAPLTFVVP